MSPQIFFFNEYNTHCEIFTIITTGTRAGSASSYSNYEGQSSSPISYNSPAQPASNATGSTESPGSVLNRITTKANTSPTPGQVAWSQQASQQHIRQVITNLFFYSLLPYMHVQYCT